MIEKCEEGDSRWCNAALPNSGLITGTSQVVKDLQPNMKYKFRLRAKNAIGVSEPTEVDHYVTTLNQFCKSLG